jgi:hypothetical protein
MYTRTFATCSEDTLNKLSDLLSPTRGDRCANVCRIWIQLQGSKQPLTRAGHRNTIWKSQSLLVKLHVYAAQLYMWTVVVLAYTESTRSERQIEKSTEEKNFNEQASPNKSEFFIVFFFCIPLVKKILQVGTL